MDRGGRAVSSTGLRTAGPAAVAGPGDPATLTAIDRFVLERLEREGLAPAREAAPETWLRRASLDLIGLPPALRELDEFGADVGRRGEAAYAAAVDRLLASPHFGERQAIEWLDAARYADTHGFNNDSARTMWRWRDWVIDALNANLPYDRFITEQLRGIFCRSPRWSSASPPVLGAITSSTARAASSTRVPRRIRRRPRADLSTVARAHMECALS